MNYEIKLNLFVSINKEPATVVSLKEIQKWLKENKLIKQ